MCIWAQACRKSSQIWIITMGLINDWSIICGSCYMEGKQFIWPCYKRVGRTRHRVKLQASWACNMQVLVIFAKASGTLVLTVTYMRHHYWWNPVLSCHEQEAAFIHLIWLHMWHWNKHSPKMHHFCDLSEVKKDGWWSWSSELTCLLGQHMGVTLILAHARYQEKEASY